MTRGEAPPVRPRRSGVTPAALLSLLASVLTFLWLAADALLYLFCCMLGWALFLSGC